VAVQGSYNEKMLAVVTIVAKNYLAQASILERSFLEFHPEAEFFTLLIDGNAESKENISSQGTILIPSDLDIENETLERMATIYDVMEFATALKPKALELVLKLTGKNVAYIDPDIEIFKTLDVVVEGLENHPIVLTPHNIFPMPRDGMETSEQAIRYSGIFNLGFVAVSSKALPFLNWWHVRLITDAVVDFESSLFTDQRWVDFVPALFDVKVLKNPGLNVAYWNIHERDLSRNSVGEVLANGEPLYFYHFSGYDPLTPWILTKHDGGRPRFSFENSAVLRELCDHYGNQLERNNFSSLRKTPYGLNRSVDGFPLTKEIRRSYRNWWLSAMSNGEAWPPSAFSKVEKFLEWMTTPVLGALHSSHSRAERALWENSTYLQERFPDIDATSSVSYRDWLDRSPERKSLYNQITEIDSTKIDIQLSGWNVLSINGDEGDLADMRERCKVLVLACGLPVQQVKIRESTLPKGFEFRSTVSAFPVYEDLIAINLNGEAGRLFDQAGFTRRPARRRILLNMWDFNEATSETEAMYRNFEEIWCPSDFVVRSLPKSCRQKAVPITIPLEDPANFAGISKSVMGLSDDFIFLSVFNGGRSAGRDNPLAVLESYLQGFQAMSGTRLVIRIVNDSQSLRVIARMRYLAQGRPDVTFLVGDVRQGEIIGLINAADCYISMHRTTAFGANMARAVLAGKPLIATGYSGNLAFMGDLGLKVEYSLEKVGKDDSFAPEYAQWAEADVDDAASKMRIVANDYSRVSEAAREWSTQIREKYSIQNSVQSVRSSILGI
jgi:hypothetical protein